MASLADGQPDCRELHVILCWLKTQEQMWYTLYNAPPQIEQGRRYNTIGQSEMVVWEPEK